MESIVTGPSYILYTLISLGLYIFMAWCLVRIARKLGVKNSWMGWVPILNFITVGQCAGFGAFLIILLFIPIVNIFVALYAFSSILTRMNRPAWWVILLLVPLVNFVILYLVSSGIPRANATAGPIAVDEGIENLKEGSCPSCHSPVEAGDLFCGECGFSLSGNLVNRKKRMPAFVPVILLLATLAAIIWGLSKYAPVREKISAWKNTAQSFQIQPPAETGTNDPSDDWQDREVGEYPENERDYPSDEQEYLPEDDGEGEIITSSMEGGQYHVNEAEQEENDWFFITEGDKGQIVTPEGSIEIPLNDQDMDRLMQLIGEHGGVLNEALIEDLKTIFPDLQLIMPEQPIEQADVKNQDLGAKMPAKDLGYFSGALYKEVDNMPLFNGAVNTTDSQKKIDQYLLKALYYTEEAFDAGITGSILVEFIVEANGSISNPKVIRGLGYGLDEVAVEVIRSMDEGPYHWTPGNHKGENVRVLYNLELPFK